MPELIDLIPDLGFPIFCVIALGWFAWYMVRHMTETNAKNMADVQDRCKEREKILYEQIAKDQEINSKFAEIISKHESILENMRQDVTDIKQDVLIIKTKI